MVDRFGRPEVKLVVRREELVVVVRRKLVAWLLSEQHGGLVRPAAGDVADRVATTPENKGRDVEALHEAVRGYVCRRSGVRLLFARSCVSHEF